MKGLRLFILTALLCACDARVDDESDGDVLRDSTYEAIDYTLTSENYNKWMVAQQALESAGIRPIERIDVRNVSADDIGRVTQSLESQPAAKSAIEEAGLSVRDFVLTTIALVQSWDAVNGPSARVLGARPENLDFLRTQAATDSMIRNRPGAGIIDDASAIDATDSDTDSDSDDKRGRGRGKGKHKGRGRG
jgi:hypothetical protein